jgi:hypothetical protein
MLIKLFYFSYPFLQIFSNLSFFLQSFKYISFNSYDITINTIKIIIFLYLGIECEDTWLKKNLFQDFF